MAKLRRTPFRCRGCHNRFYVYVPRDKDELEAPAETPEIEATDSNEEEEHKPDLAKPAEP